MGEAFDQIGFVFAMGLMGVSFVVSPLVMLAAGVLEVVDYHRAHRFDREAKLAEHGLCPPAFLTPLEQAAYHEAGHILVAAVFGIPIRAAIVSEQGEGRVYPDLTHLKPEDPIREAVPVVLMWVAGPIAEAKLACCNAGESLRAAVPDFAKAVEVIGHMTPLEGARAEQAALLVFGRATLILMHECRQTLEQIVRLLLEKRVVVDVQLELITKRSSEIDAARAKIKRRNWNQHLVEMVNRRVEGKG